MIKQGTKLKDNQGRVWTVKLIELNIFETEINMTNGLLKRQIEPSELRDYEVVK